MLIDKSCSYHDRRQKSPKSKIWLKSKLNIVFNNSIWTIMQNQVYNSNTNDHIADLGSQIERTTIKRIKLLITDKSNKN